MKATDKPKTFEQALEVIAAIKAHSDMLYAEVLKYKQQRNEARARIAELESRGPITRIMDSLGYEKKRS